MAEVEVLPLPRGTACVTPPGPQLPQQPVSLGDGFFMHPSAEIWGLAWSLAHKYLFVGL